MIFLITNFSTMGVPFLNCFQFLLWLALPLINIKDNLQPFQLLISLTTTIMLILYKILIVVIIYIIQKMVLVVTKNLMKKFKITKISITIIIIWKLKKNSKMWYPCPQRNKLEIIKISIINNSSHSNKEFL